MLMTEYPAISEDVLDAVAEITNMIIGNVKTALENRLGSMLFSTPTVIYGRNFQTRSARNQEWTVVPFVGNRTDVRASVYSAQSGRGRRNGAFRFPGPVHVECLEPNVRNTIRRKRAKK